MWFLGGKKSVEEKTLRGNNSISIPSRGKVKYIAVDPTDDTKYREVVAVFTIDNKGRVDLLEVKTGVFMDGKKLEQGDQVAINKGDVIKIKGYNHAVV